jgi:hypothetical protein
MTCNDFFANTPNKLVCRIQINGQGTGRATHCDDRSFDPVAYPGFFFGGGVQQIQFRTEDREKGDLWAVVP